MLALTLCLLLTVPQGERPPVPSSAHLPGDRTLLVLEIAGWPQLVEHRSAICQLSVFELEKVRRLTDWLAENSNSRPTRDRLVGLAAIGALFDEGITAATIFPPAGNDASRREPQACLLGAASNAASLRDAGARLEKALIGDAKPEDVVVETRALADSPVQVRSVRRERDYGNDYGQTSGLATAVKGRLMAVQSLFAWGQNEERKQSAKGFGDDLAELLGLVRTPPGGWKLGELPSLAPGETFLGRFVLRFHDNACRPERTNERAQKEMKQLWFWGFEGMQSWLVAGQDGRVRERIELRRLPQEERVFLDGFKDGERGLGDVAAYLPTNTLAALRLCLDLDKAAAWAYGLEGFDGTKKDEIREFLHYLRQILGLDAKAKELGQDDPPLSGLDDVALALLPGAAGSPAPELALLVRCEPRPDQTKEALATIVDLMQPLMPGEMHKKLEVRASGDGDGTVHTLRLKDLLGGEGGMIAMGTLGFNLLGGGFLSATRVGPYFVLGCNPRTVRGLHEAVRSGETLDKRADFAARFPKGKGRALEGFVDLPTLAGSMKAFDALSLAMFGWLALAPADDTMKLPPLPQLKDLAPALAVEWLYSEKADFGWVVHHEGGTLLSPVAWAAFGYLASLLNTFESVFR